MNFKNFETFHGSGIVSIGNYDLSGVCLGKGAFGDVQKACHIKTKTPVALKLLNLNDLTNPQDQQFLGREAKILLNLRHPNIVRFIEVCNSANIFCTVFEFIEGNDLNRYLKKNQGLEESQAKGIAGQIAAGLAYLHANDVIHRDLKPDNIMLSGKRVVIIDFGFSAKWRRGEIMQCHPGSPDFAAPELFNGDPYYGPPIDIWSFGGK